MGCMHEYALISAHSSCECWNLKNMLGSLEFIILKKLLYCQNPPYPEILNILKSYDENFFLPIFTFTLNVSNISRVYYLL